MKTEETLEGVATIIAIVVLFGVFAGILYFGEKNVHEQRIAQKILHDSMTEKEKCLWQTRNTLNVEKKMLVIKTCNEIYE
jgi:hypothetical protein